MPVFLGGRRSIVARARLRRQSLFVLGGVAVGAAAVGLALAGDTAGATFGHLITRFPLLPLLLTPLGFTLCSTVSRRYFPNSGGSGIPQAIAARQVHSLAGRHRLVSLRLAAGKILLLLVGLLCGASIGREGPTVQVGASLMFAAGRLSPRRQPGLILAGAAAGVSAAFNTPLAGIVFAIEEMSQSFEARASGVVIAAVIAAGITSLALQGDYTYFGNTHATLHSWQGWLAVPVLGLAGGLSGGAFSRILIACATGRLAAAIARWPTMFAFACGLALAAAGLLSHGDAFGTGYAQARALVQGSAAAPGLAFVVWKFLATLASSLSAIPGGIFAPSLAVGAGLGHAASALLPGASAQGLVVLGMVAYFTGVVQAPITAFVIVTEMTNDHALVVPLMLAALIAYGASRLVCPHGIYHALARGFVQQERLE